MVKLTTIYTRGGDSGMTSLVGGERAPKHALRLEVIGQIDETNAVIGLTGLYVDGEEAAMLERIQHDLFDLGADVATPAQHAKDLRVSARQVMRLEQEIDAMNQLLHPLESFVLPGGSAASAHLHLARTVARRAERRLSALVEKEPVGAETLRYLNRLSDHLFVLARRTNDNGKTDTLWTPGKNR